MSVRRLFAFIVGCGLLVAAAFIASRTMTAAPVTASAPVERVNITERSLELHGRNLSTGSGWGENITERSLELQGRNLATASGWGENITERSLELHSTNSAASNSAPVSRMRENITERTMLMHQHNPAGQ